MAIKKSQLYATLWKSCDELRGGMDASQYKDYILVLLFVKYISDRYGEDADSVIEVPKGETLGYGGGFQDMVYWKHKDEIGDQMNTIIGRLAKANDLTGIITVANFNDPDKLGKGKDMRDRLSNLIALFENPALNFSKNRADGDDILGDAYEYLMRNFATESGKSKGQFYTPSEVSRILAQVVGMAEAESQDQTLYDPTCGSGSLLLKAADEAPSGITIYGQEKDNATRALAVMNMWLHGNPDAIIWQDNTLATPYFKNKLGGLETFDFIVANPPFSDKAWGNGFVPEEDVFERFEGYGIPPSKNGDYAYLLHVIRSLKRKGKAAVILPHGVLFRGNAEAEIRQNLIKRGYIKGIIGLPANLFYGTGIPACIIVIDKEAAASRRGIFMMDASKGFIKDGNKNRLREQDIHKIVDIFDKQTEFSKYARLIPYQEIEDNEYNLNIPRYIDSQETEDIQDIGAHLLGGIPNADIEKIDQFWQIFPNLRDVLFAPTDRPAYSQLKVARADIKTTIFGYTEFVDFLEEMKAIFANWETTFVPYLKALDKNCQPKKVIVHIAERLITDYTNKPLIDKYDMFQHLMNYWEATMKDDCYILSEDGWQAEVYLVYAEKDKKQEKPKGWDCDLVPKDLVTNRYFMVEKQELISLGNDLESVRNEISEIQEEHGGEEDALNDVSSKADAEKALDNYMELAWKKYQSKLFSDVEHLRKEAGITKEDMKVLETNPFAHKLKNGLGDIMASAIKKRAAFLDKNEEGNEEETKFLKEYISLTEELKHLRAAARKLRKEAFDLLYKQIKANPEGELFKEIRIVQKYLELLEKEADLKKAIKAKEKELDDKLLEKYQILTTDEIKTLVVNDKWMSSLRHDIHAELDRVSQRLTQRIADLAERYEYTMPQLTKKVEDEAKKVSVHLQKMGLVWK